MGRLTRETRLQIMLTDDELKALDDWRFKYRLPSRASAIRELLKKGLAVEGITIVASTKSSTDFGVIESAPRPRKKKRKASEPPPDR
jgi:hypothetical protein